MGGFGIIWEKDLHDDQRFNAKEWYKMYISMA